MAPVSAILGFEEEKSIKWISSELKRDPVCLAHDGAVSPCYSMGSLLSHRMDCERIGRGRGIWVAAKKWENLAQIEDESGLIPTCRSR